MNRRILFAGALCAMAAFAGPSAADEKIGGEINILSWGNYIDFALKPFEEKYGVKVRAWRGSGKDILRRAITETPRRDAEVVLG